MLIILRQTDGSYSIFRFRYRIYWERRAQRYTAKWYSTWPRTAHLVLLAAESVKDWADESELVRALYQGTVLPLMAAAGFIPPSAEASFRAAASEA